MAIISALFNDDINIKFTLCAISLIALNQYSIGALTERLEKSKVIKDD